MNRAAQPGNAGAKRAESHILAELLRRNRLPDRAPGGFRLTTPAGRRLELQVAHPASPGQTRFAVASFRPRPELFHLCTELDGGEISGVWVLPSTVFFAYSDTAKESGRRHLDLDANHERCLGRPFRQYNSFFRNRWEPVTQFDRYRRYMKPWDTPDFADGWEDFEDLMRMLAADETWETDEAGITGGEYASEGVSGFAAGALN